MSLHLNLGAVVLHFERNQTTTPFRSVDEGERERKGTKRKQGQLRVTIGLGRPST